MLWLLTHPAPFQLVEDGECTEPKKLSLPRCSWQNASHSMRAFSSLFPHIVERFDDEFEPMVAVDPGR